MIFRTWLVATIVLVIGLIPSSAWASFAKSTAGKIDSVIWEPNEADATRIQLHGVFATLPSEVDKEWTAPSLGYIYYACPEGSEEACRAEWQDIVQINSNLGCVAFGANIFENIRPAGEEAVDPDPYLFVAFGGVTYPAWLDCVDLVADSPPVCGNNLVEAGESCDGDCPTSCDIIPESTMTGCGQPGTIGSSDDCNVLCTYDSVIFGCKDDDGCCRWISCSPAEDNDCIEGDPPVDPPDTSTSDVMEVTTAETVDDTTEETSVDTTAEPQEDISSPTPSGGSGGCQAQGHSRSGFGLLFLLAVGLLLLFRRDPTTGSP